MAGNYRFNGNGALHLQQGAEIAGRAFFTDSFERTSETPWNIAGKLDFLTFGGSLPEQLLTAKGGLLITPRSLRFDSIQANDDQVLLGTFLSTATIS